MMQLITPMIRRWRQDATEDPDSFWAKAAEQLPWFCRWDRVFEWERPTFRWFSNAQTNLSYNALDHHVRRGWGGHTALIALNERGEERLLTYTMLLREVERVAAALRGMGIRAGDRITIYMPTCAEAIILMLATVRIGAIHSVVFAGFGANALADRVNASGSRLIFTSDITFRKGKEIDLKSIVDAAVMHGCPAVEQVVTLWRGSETPQASHNRDMTWDSFLERGQGESGSYVPLESNEPAFILATSGTTARPKLVVHKQGGYQVHIHSMASWMFGLRETDVWWSTSDIGWIVGHSYIVYAPLLRGSTTIAYEGAIDYPSPAQIWQIIEAYGVTGLFTSPTAVRLLMRYGADYAHHNDLSSLERVFCAGETLNAPAWKWLQYDVLDNRVPVIDHMWQTETSGPIFGNPYGLGLMPIKAGSAGIPLPGIEAVVVTPGGEPVASGEKGIMAIKRPFPGMVSELWHDTERYQQDYWGRIPSLYSTGDSAHMDADGYVWFAGRADELIKIAAHRIGTIEVETAFLKHPAVAEAGVTGRPDALRGEVISAFVVLKQGSRPSDELRQQLLDTVRQELGTVAVIGEIEFVSMLPKTRSGKIMRRVLKAVTQGRDPGDITTIEDEASVEEARQAWFKLNNEVNPT